MKGNIGRGIVIGVAVCCVLGVVVATVMAMTGKREVEEVEIEETEVEDTLGREKTQAEIDNEDEGIETVRSIAEWAVDIEDPKEVAEKSTNIAMVKIDRIEGFGNYAEVSGRYTMPYTYGKMTVLQNIKGELPMNEELKFYRIGGVLSAEEYYTGLGEEMKAKYAEMNADDPELWTKKTRYMMEDDVKVELGKVYLVYLKPDIVYEKDSKAYGMILAQAGTREAQKGENGEWEVLNNFTGEWEKLSEVEGI